MFTIKKNFSLRLLCIITSCLHLIFIDCAYRACEKSPDVNAAKIADMQMYAIIISYLEKILILLIYCPKILYIKL